MTEVTYLLVLIALQLRTSSASEPDFDAAYTLLQTAEAYLAAKQTGASTSGN